MDQHTAAWIFFIVLLLVILRQRRHSRSRYISAHDKRVAEAKHALDWETNPETRGKPYRRKNYHIDHFVPHVRGGSNRARNLRLIRKEENLRKGAKMPTLWERFWNG